MRDRLSAFSRWCVFAALFFSPWYLQWTVSVPGLDLTTAPVANLPKLRPADLFAILSIGAYAISGWPGLRKLSMRPARIWFWSAVGLAMWGAASIVWAANGSLAAVFAIHLTLWILFAVRVASDDVPPISIAWTLMAGLMINSAVGVVQFSLQHSLGLTALGELPLDPTMSGVSVIGGDSRNVLRLYGLSGHPNVMGGFASAALLWSVGLIARSPRRRLPVILLAWSIGCGTLLLTFSRSAWLGTAIGLASMAALIRRPQFVSDRLRRMKAMGGIAIIPIVVLTIALGPVFLQRLAPMQSPLESLSIWNRIDLIHAAARMFIERPLTGVGLGNFQIFHQQLYEFTGPAGWVHNVPLLIASELGLPGFVLWSIGVISIVLVIDRHRRLGDLDMWQIAAAGSTAAMLSIMMFDHYTWTSSQGVYVWAAVTGWVMSRSRPNPQI